MSLTGKTIGQLTLLGTPTADTLIPVEYNDATYHIEFSSITSNSTVEVTYSELVDKITGETLNTGSYYIITDFRTCYDQPDFNVNGAPITTGNYKQSDVEPIVVFATSANTISTTAYQPLYPNDRIQYDWTWNMTEVTSGTSYGRITERIDEFNNRTDYDHRTILFKRYRLYTYREGLRLNGTIELFNNGIVSGTSTSFTALTVGDVVYIPNADPSYYEIIGITGNTSMRVSGDTIGTTGTGSTFYLAVDENNDGGGYFSYKRTNVKTNDFIEYTTFGDAIDESFAKNNYIGNFANIHTNIDPPYTFLLANNVFIEGHYLSNKFGDWCFNNTFGTDNENNIWGDWCYQNVSTNDIDFNIIGHYFHDNLINTNLTSNNIGNNFNNNQLLGENSEDFEDNIIGNGFNNNIIYSRFYKNEILDNFNDNVIGDFGNLDDYEFYRNYIRNNFNQNIIRDDFQNNQIGSNFNNNTINGEFIGNTILNGFNNNQTGDYFALNNIGNGYNNNNVYDNFRNNSTDYYFYNNIISNNFNENNVGIDFQDNRPYNYTLFGWNNLSTVSTRNYELFYDAIDTDFNDKVLGKEFVMKIISTSQYFKIKFTQWTSGNGGGFQYERQEIDFSGSPIGNSITFNKTNGGSEVDIIVEGVVEITRGDSDGIYNIATEGSWNSGVSPQDTEWNSIYTQTNNGNNFRNNVIGNNFEDNIIGDNFEDNQIGFDFQNNEIINDFNKNEIASGFNNNSISGETSTNRIGEQFENNTIYGDFYDNQIFNEFKGNITYESFYKNRLDWGFGGNQISGYCGENTFGPMIDSNDFLGDVYQNTFKGGVFSNTIGNNFANNNIGVGFSGNIIGEGFGNGYNAPQGNTIGNYFYDNTIGEYFYNNTIADNFHDNEVGNYFQWNVINTNIDTTYFTLNYGNITGFSYTAAGTGATNNTYSGIQACGTTQSMGVDASFNVEVSGGTVIGVSGNSEGRLYQNNDELTILGTQIGGVTGVIDGFSSDAVGKSGTTGTYDNVFAQGTGAGENGSFNIIVVDDLVDSISLSGGGSSYLIGDVLTIDGSVFGGVDGVDDITITVSSIYSDDIVITVTGTTSGSSFYQHYTKQIFERRLGDKRVSFYDEDDILNVDSVYEILGYIPGYSQPISFPLNNSSFEFECDGNYTNNGATSGFNSDNAQELVSYFNSNYRSFGYFFDNNDGTIGLYINPPLKQQYCPSGTYSIYVFND
jgi:hypothetical protein